jgi:acyl dehydratase
VKRETFLEKKVGYSFSTEEIPILEEELKSFYAMWGDTETLFSDDDFARSVELNFQGRIVAGFFLVGVMLAKLDMLPGAGLTRDAALVGMNEVRFIAPAYPGDHLRLHGELLNKKKTSKGHTLVDWKWQLLKPDGREVASGINTELFPKAMPE